MTTLDFIGFTSVKDAGAYFGDSDNLHVAVSLTVQDRCFSIYVL